MPFLSQHQGELCAFPGIKPGKQCTVEPRGKICNEFKRTLAKKYRLHGGHPPVVIHLHYAVTSEKHRHAINIFAPPKIIKNQVPRLKGYN